MRKDKTDVLIVVDYAKEPEFTQDDLCEKFGFSSDFIQTLIEYDVIYPQKNHINELIFDAIQLNRIQAALRLQRDLELNLAGVALALDLLDQLQELRQHSEFLEKYLLKNK